MNPRTTAISLNPVVRAFTGANIESIISRIISADVRKRGITVEPICLSLSINPAIICLASLPDEPRDASIAATAPPTTTTIPRTPTSAPSTVASVPRTPIRAVPIETSTPLIVASAVIAALYAHVAMVVILSEDERSP